MSKSKLSSKGQVTIPRRFRERMGLTDQREIEMEQLEDGAVLIRPVRSILDLAGQLKPKHPLLKPAEQRRRARLAMAKRHQPKGKR